MDLVRIAKVMKEARQQQRLTVEGLADRAGVSKTLISRIENFRVTPSIRTLTSVAKSLGLPMAEFFEEGRVAAPYVRGSLDRGEKIERDHSEKFGLSYHALAFEKPDRAMHPFLVTYKPSQKMREFKMHESEELFLLLEGSVDFFIYDTTRVERLKKGDTMYLSKNIPHTVRLAKGQKLAKALVVWL
ncbi:MAG: helix-turn-helix transcriptional regulator [Spirochaetia bacterium]|nr:helix-turn-helix transcriptional regulator [Spirochaetia bacterium]